MQRCLPILIALLAILAFAAPSGAAVLPQPSTPQLIERAQLGKAETLRMLTYAIARPDRLPQRFRSDARWDGTLHLHRLRAEAPKLRDAAARREILGILEPGQQRINEEPSLNCSVLSLGPNPQAYESEYFYIEYPDNAVFAGGLTIEDYAESLDGAWEKEINEFGYAAPPIFPGTPAGKYNVRVGPLGAGLYGFVDDMGTYAGEVGDNPNTAWTEDDAAASCMGLNSDYENGFEQLTVGTARQRLDATTAHEFLHSIQYGYGALDFGDHEPDSNFVEGMATWMEDEAYDSADDSHNYLYPEFRDSMGEHDQGSEYSYFLTWRGLTERFGASAPGVGEDFIQRFWETISREEFGQMDALENAYSQTGVALATGYHDYAIAARFLKACGGGYVLPFCFEEADAYADVAGERPEPDGSIDALGGSYGNVGEPVEIEDNYTLNWVDLPGDAGPIEAVLDHRGNDGRLRLSIICDTGSGLRISPRVPALPSEGGNVRFDPAGCQSRPSAVITNEHRPGGHNPEDSTFTPYVLTARAVPQDPPAPAPPPEPPAIQPPPVTPFVAPPPAPCDAGSRLASASVRPSGRGLRMNFVPRGGARVDIDVFQASIGRRVIGGRRVARFRGRERSFTWDGVANQAGRRVRNGHLFVRFRARNATGSDIRRSAIVRSRGRFLARPGFSRAERCAALAAYKLLRPVFGGRDGRSASVSYVLGSPARVTLEVLEGGVVVRRIRRGLQQPARTYRVIVGARSFIRGDVTFRLRLEREGAAPLVARLVARRL
ncbi:MAG TPA: DUF6055 domain-containing protein [Solirubrobacteraceae bacterium]|nr:DUF6055 domain-containing protein [Solirubrobacteraceae bacterium]